MECNISSNGTRWSCTISLRVGEGRQHAFSPELTSKDEVELWIRRAQAAVLCPHIRRDTFTTKGREELREISTSSTDPNVQKFTADIVTVDICDPDGADLVFIDLPGIVHNSDGKLISDLVRSYIMHASTLILVVIPAGSDIEVQEAMTLAKEADPQGARTIGVVTKPDALTPGASDERSKWQAIFEGNDEVHRLINGYYCVRLPDNDERKRNITRREAERLAMNYLTTTAPWKDLKVKNRLGIATLVKNVSQLLMDMLLSALPKLKKDVNDRLAACIAELGALHPELLANDATAAVVQLLSNFCRDVQDIVYGHSEDKSFVHRSRDAYHALRFNLRATAPEFRPFEDEAHYNTLEAPAFQQEEDAAYMGFEHDDIVEEMPVMGLYDVKTVIKESRGWELPHNTPYEAKVRLIKMSVSRWSTPSKKCFGRVQYILRDIIDATVSKHFQGFAPLENYIMSLLDANMNEFIGVATKALDVVLKREDMPYWTENEHYLEVTRQKWYSHYKSVRKRKEDAVFQSHNRRLSKLEREELEATALRSLYALGFRDLNHTHDLTIRLIPGGSFDEELQVMADVRSYFQVAYKRVADNIPMTIQHDLVQGFADGLLSHLLARLELGTPDATQRLQNLLAEDPEVTRTRRRLKGLRDQLEGIKARLDNFKI